MIGLQGDINLLPILSPFFSCALNSINTAVLLVHKDSWYIEFSDMLKNTGKKERILMGCVYILLELVLKPFVVVGKRIK